MSAKGQISHWQATAFIVSTILPTAILFMPSITARSAGRDSWLSLLAGLAFGLAVAVTASMLASRFPGETVVEYAPRILGRFLGKVVGFIYVFYFYYAAFTVQREFAELMTSAYMPFTPLWMHIAVLTVIACYALYLGLEPICRANSIIVVVLMLSIGAIFLITIKNVDLYNFTPVLDTPAGRIVFGALAPSSWYSECGMILMLVPFLEDKKKTARITISAVLIISIFFYRYPGFCSAFRVEFVQISDYSWQHFTDSTFPGFLEKYSRCAGRVGLPCIRAICKFINSITAPFTFIKNFTY